MPVYRYRTKRGYRWMAKVFVDGRQYAKKGLMGKREARKAEKLLLETGKAPLPKKEPRPKANGPLLSAVAEDFFEVQSTQLKSSTLRALKSRYRNHIASSLADLPVDSYSFAVLSRWWKGLGASSLKEKNAVLGLLKKLFSHADVYFGIANREPGKLLPYRDFSIHERKERRFLTFAQFEKVYALEEDGLFRLYLLVSFFTGMRISEARGLQGKCFDGERLHVFQQVQSKCDGTGWRLTTPKTKASVRSYLLPSFLAERIARHVEENGIGRESFLFFARSSKDRGHLLPIGENTIQRELRRLSRETGIPFTSHSFRHGDATLLASMGVPIEEIGRYLGHSSQEVTRAFYVHETEEEKKRIASLLDMTFRKAFSEPKKPDGIEKKPLSGQ